MKKLIVIALLAFTLPAMAQWGSWEKVEGNGKLTRQTRDVGNFHAISSAGSWDVMIAYGESNSIQVEGDENLLQYIETKVEGEKLVIRTRNVNLRTRNKITVYVSVTQLTSVSLSGSGDIIGDGKFSNDGEGVFKVSGSGSIRISFDKYRSVDTHISGSGDIRLSGSAGSLTAQISGSGSIDCVDLIADDVTANISGSGNIKAYANKSIEARVSGSGSVRYKGAAKDVSIRRAGSGRISKI